jgi:hypothetical protein
MISDTESVYMEAEEPAAGNETELQSVSEKKKTWRLIRTRA